MVGGSELAFRLLARRHGAQLCYTPMIRAEEFSKPGAGVNLLERHADDCPVVAHFSGNDPQLLLDVARKAERCPGVVAIDLNLGCPQRSAHSGHFGAFLCDPVDRKLLLSIVSTLSRSLRVPFFCKIRLLNELDDTLEFAHQLQDAGCSLLAVHGRYRGSPMHRRDGPAHLDQIAAIKQTLSIPVITNGNVRNAAELAQSLQITGADGVMTAEGALDDPAIFAKAIAHVHAERARLTAEVKQAKALKAAKRGGRQLSNEEKAMVKGRKETKARLERMHELRPPPPLSPAVPMPPSPAHAAAASTSAAADGAASPPSGQFDLAEQYISLVEKHPPPGGKDALLSHSIFHLRRLCRTPLTEFDLLADLKACTNLAACAGVIRRCRAYAEGAMAFEGAEAESAKKESEAKAARLEANAARRAEFVARMTAKAKAEGKAADWYLAAGRAPPTAADLNKARRMVDKKALTKWWRATFGQHCQGHHVDGACPHLADARGCGFLHGVEGEV